MNIPREFIDLLLAKTDIVDLINAQIPLRKKSGSNYFARCPFHNEKSASFSVSQPKQFYYCFGCGAHGNAIDFLMNHERLNFPEAIEALARHCGMEIPQTSGTPVKKNETLPALYDLMTNITQWYYNQMSKSQRAIEYLKNRGITGQIAKQFSLGYALSGWSHLLDHFGKSDVEKKQLLEAGLIIKKDDGGYYDRFRDRIMFPIHDYRGRIIGFGGRILDQGEPKYLNSPETSLFQKGHELYGLYQALQENRKLTHILIVEGYMDVIALFQHGVTYAVATLGTATTSHHIHRLTRYTSELIFCFDGDEAGRTAAWRALQVLFPLMNDQLQVRFLFLPEGEDPDSLIRKEGKTAFEKRVHSAASLSAFFLNTLSQQSDMQTLEGRAKFAASALNYIKQLPSGLLPGIMIEELGKRARVDIIELKQQVKNIEETSPEDITLLAPQQNMGNTQPAMRKAIALLIQYPSLGAMVKEPLPHNKLPGQIFLTQLLEMIQKNPNVTTGGLIEYWRGQKEEKIIAKLAQMDHIIPAAAIEREFLGALRQLQLLSFDTEINRLLAKAAQEDLNDEEKLELTGWINRKKQLATV